MTASAIRQQTVLLVEDEPFFARMCQHALAKPGRTLQVVSDGKAAMKELRLNPPDLLILDLLLPHVDGFFLLDFLRSSPVMFPIIILSNLGKEVDRDMYRDFGVCEYCVKSETDLDDLAARVDRLLAS